MKLMRYSRRHEPSSRSRLGVLVGADLVADLRAGYALYLVDEVGNRKGPDIAELYLPSYIAQFLHIGEPAWLALGDAYSYLVELSATSPGATGLAGEPLFLPLSECRLYAPVRPLKLIACGLRVCADRRLVELDIHPAGRVAAGQLEHFGGHVDADRLAGRPHPLGGEEHVQSAAGTEIGPAQRRFRRVARNLGRIEHMAPPEVRESGRRDEIYAFLPLDQKAHRDQT